MLQRKVQGVILAAMQIQNAVDCILNVPIDILVKVRGDAGAAATSTHVSISGSVIHRVLENGRGLIHKGSVGLHLLVMWMVMVGMMLLVVMHRLLLLLHMMHCTRRLHLHHYIVVQMRHVLVHMRVVVLHCTVLAHVVQLIGYRVVRL